MEQLNYDKIVEIDFHDATYLMHIKVNPTLLQIDIQDKITGDVWLNQFSASDIENITQKTGNFKRFNVFIKMLILSLSRSSQTVELDLLSFHDLEMLKSRKANKSTNTSISNNKRYLMLNYIVEFDKVHYPLSLNKQQIPNPQRMNMTIRRLRSQLQIYKKGGNKQEAVRQLSYMKQQNDLLKGRIKKLEEAPPTIIKQTQRIIQKDQKSNQQLKQLQSSYKQSQQQIKNLKSKFEEKQKQNKQLKNEISKLLKQINKLDKVYQKQKEQLSKNIYEQLNTKLNDLTKQTTELVSQLNFSREQQKKAKLRVAQLEKQLQSLLKRNVISTKRPATPTSSNKKSEKKVDFNKKNIVRKKSVIDSDTQSSKMRKMANRNVSPFRNSNAVKSPFTKPKDQSSVNKSKSKKQSRNSPRSNVFTESEQNLDGNQQSDSDSEIVSQTMAMLRKRKQLDNKKKITKKEQRQNQKQKINMQSGLEKKISHLAEMLRKSREQKS